MVLNISVKQEERIRQQTLDDCMTSMDMSLSKLRNSEEIPNTAVHGNLKSNCDEQQSYDNDTRLPKLAYSFFWRKKMLLVVVTNLLRMKYLILAWNLVLLLQSRSR